MGYSVTELMSDGLLGMDRNSAEGMTQAPESIVNLEPSAAGGYQLRGLLASSGSFPYYLYDQPFGYDHKGWASFGRTDVGNVLINTPTTQKLNVTGTGAWSYGVHLPQAGFYGAFDSYFFVDVNGEEVTTRNGVYPSISKGSDGYLAAGTYALFCVLYCQTAESRVALMAMRQFFATSGTTGKFIVSFGGGTPKSSFSIDVYMSQKLTGASVAYDVMNRYFLAGTLSPGDTTFSIPDVPIGPDLALLGYGLPFVSALSRPEKKGPLAYHNGRSYFVPASGTGSPYRLHLAAYDTPGAAPAIDANKVFRSTPPTFTPLTLAWTEPNTHNLFNPLASYQPVAAKSSTAITGFSSSEEGLLIFCDNETFLMRGDPSYIAAERYDDFNINPLLPIGNDAGVIPGELGSDVYVIWKGEVWRVSGGNAENVSKPVFLRTDRFVQVVGEVERNCIVCRTASGRTFYHYPQTQFWGEGPGSVGRILPTQSDNGTVYTRAGNAGADVVNPARKGGTYTAKAVLEIDMNSKLARKEFAYLRVPVSQVFTGSITLTYKADRGSTRTVTGKRKSDAFVFPIEVGCVGNLFTCTFDFTGMNASDTIEAPLTAEWTPRDVPY